MAFFRLYFPPFSPRFVSTHLFLEFIDYLTGELSLNERNTVSKTQKPKMEIFNRK